MCVIISWKGLVCATRWSEFCFFHIPTVFWGHKASSILKWGYRSFFFPLLLLFLNMALGPLLSELPKLYKASTSITGEAWYIVAVSITWWIPHTHYPSNLSKNRQWSLLHWTVRKIYLNYIDKQAMVSQVQQNKIHWCCDSRKGSSKARLSLVFQR